jgi:hypothetical protein
MGQPTTQTVYQQPSKAEQDANKLSNQQKTAALAKINQAVRGESMGLRGMGGLYEWAGPTPWLAGDPRARAPGGGGPGPSTGGGYTVPPGYEQPGSVVPGYGTAPGLIAGPGVGPGVGGGAGQGPPGDRSAPTSYIPYPSTTPVGPRGDQTTPQFFQTSGYQGGPRGDRTTIPAGQPGTYTGNVYTPKTAPYLQAVRQRLGLPSLVQGNAPTPAAFTTGTTPMQRQVDKSVGVTPQQPGRLPVPPAGGASQTQLDVYGRAISGVEGGKPVTVQPGTTPNQARVLQNLGIKPAAPATVTGPVGVQPVGAGAPAAQPAAAQPTVAQIAPAVPRVTAATPAVLARPTAAPIISPAPPAARTQPAITPPKPLIVAPKPSIYQTLSRVGAGGGGNR